LKHIFYDDGEMHVTFYLGNLKKIDHLGDLGIDERIIPNGC